MNVIKNAQLKEIRRRIEAAISGDQFNEAYLRWVFSDPARRKEFGWRVTNRALLFKQITESPDGAIRFINHYYKRTPRQIAVAIAAIDPEFQPADWE